MYFCDYFIEHPTDPHGGTYCKLRAGHGGDHSLHYPRQTKVEQRFSGGPITDTGSRTPPHGDPLRK